MVKFWDTSALVPLLVGQPSTQAVGGEFAADPDVVVWWATGVECMSALARLEREQVLDGEEMTLAIGRLDGLAASWREIQPGAPMRRTASRLLRTHSLRAADAFLLAAARAASEDRPETLSLVTLDDRLALAAQREGFDVIRPIT